LKKEKIEKTIKDLIKSNLSNFKRKLSDVHDKIIHKIIKRRGRIKLIKMEN
jgi:hypothetical protein